MKGRNLSKKRNRNRERNTKGDTTGTSSSSSICNYNCNTYGQRNPLLVFPIVECLFPVIYLQLGCVSYCSRIARSIPRGLIFMSLQYALVTEGCFSFFFQGGNAFLVLIFWPHFHFGPYFFILSFLVPKMEKTCSILIPTIILLTENSLCGQWSGRSLALVEDPKLSLFSHS